MSDTESVVSSAVAAAGDMGGEAVSVDTTPTETVEAAAPVAETVESPVETGDGTELAPQEVAPVEQPVADPLASAGPIPLKEHKKILDNARAKIKAEYDEKYAWANAPDVRETLQAFNIAETNKPLFAKIILGDPEYQQIFQQMFQAAPQAQAAPAPVVEDIRPDALLPDGNIGYSAEAVNKLLQQREAQLEEKFNKRFEGIDPVIKTLQQREAHEHAKAQQRPILENARKALPGFEENEPAIRAKFEENLFTKGYNLESAWREVMLPKLQADREKMRQEIMAEMNARPAAVVSKTPQMPKPITGSGKTEDLVRAAIAGRS